MAHSDETKAEALAMLAGTRNNFGEVSRKLKIPDRTLRFWASGEHINTDVAKNADIKKTELSDRIEELAHKLIDAAFDADKIADASLQQVTTSLGIAVDKMRLLREQPTEISSDGLTDDQRMAKLTSLYGAVRARVAGQTAPN